MGPTWEPRTIANQLRSRGSSPAGIGTSTIAWQLGQETRSPGDGSPSRSRGWPQLSQKKVKAAWASYGFPALTWEAPDAYIAASFPLHSPGEVSRMPAKDLGTKHLCFKCGTKFYDLRKPEAICPKCGADQKDSPANRPAPEPRRGRLAAVPKPVEPAPPEPEAEETEDTEDLETFDDDEAATPDDED
jgi:uncharacterized protein (TIGR02300 family)